MEINNSELNGANELDKILYAFLIYIGILLVVVLLNMVFPLTEEPSVLHFPYMVYLPEAILIIILLLINLAIYSKNQGYTNFLTEFQFRYLEYFVWNDEPTKSDFWVQRIVFYFGVLLSTVGFAFAVGTLLIVSPLNFFYLSLTLCLIVLWIAFGIKSENNRTVLWLAILVFFNMVLLSGAIAISGNFIVLPFILSYQIVTFVIVVVKWNSNRI